MRRAMLTLALGSTVALKKAGRQGKASGSRPGFQGSKGLQEKCSVEESSRSWGRRSQEPLCLVLGSGQQDSTQACP